VGSVNKITLVGNVGKDPETKGEGDKMYSRFSVATSDYAGKGKGDEGTDYATTWHDVTVFGKTAEYVQKYVGKGTQVYVCGTLTHSHYLKKDGTAGFGVNIISREVTVVSGKRAASDTQTVVTNATVSDDEIPF
jgi:single-strand DNA-binding protein